MQERDPALIGEGDLLAGKYRVERVLGAGGMGVVVAARHLQLGQLVAIKFLKPEALAQPGAIERFLRESRAVASLRSEHISRVLDIGTLESGVPYMVMEFLDGRDLGAVLDAEGPLAVDFAVRLVHQACKALAEAHALGIVHRDLKPQNLFLTHTLQGSPRLKVLDFGISKAIGLLDGGRGGLTQTRAMLGSPLYMAPEQMRSSRQVDPRSDVWALGVVLFELLTKRWPFEADDLPELCLKVVSEPPLPLAEIRPEVPAALVAIVERCLEKDPARRFPSATSLASALEPFARPAALLGAVSDADAEPTVITESPFREESDYVATSVSRSDPTDLSMSASLLPGAASTRPAPASLSTASPQTPASWGTPLRERKKARRVGPPIGLAFGAVVLLVALVFGFRRSADSSSSVASSVAPSPSMALKAVSIPARVVASSVEAASPALRAEPRPVASVAPAVALSAKRESAAPALPLPRVPVSNPVLPLPLAPTATARPIAPERPMATSRAASPARPAEAVDLEIRTKR